MKNLITGAFSLLKASLCINCKLYHNNSKFHFFSLEKRLRWLEVIFKASIIFCSSSLKSTAWGARAIGAL